MLTLNRSGLGRRVAGNNAVDVSASRSNRQSPAELATAVSLVEVVATPRLSAPFDKADLPSTHTLTHNKMKEGEVIAAGSIARADRMRAVAS